MAGINNIQTRKFPRYNLPFHYRNILSGQMGRLIPIQCDEVNAGEKWKQDIHFVMRMAPMIHPSMSELDVHFYSFFVPTRIITPRNSTQSTWEKMIEGINKPSIEQPILPSMYTSQRFDLDETKRKYVAEKFGIGTLSDYLDTLCFTNEEITSASSFYLPFEHRISLNGYLCYQYIYNWWFRRDQIEPEITFPLSLGALDLTNVDNTDYVPNEEWNDASSEWYKFVDNLFKLRFKNYERDYFTSALPKPQYGEDITVGDGTLSFDYLFEPMIGVSGNARIQPSGVGNYDVLFGRKSGDLDYKAYSYLFGPNGELQLGHAVGENNVGIVGATNAPLSFNANELINQLHGTANNFTINELRLAMQMQAVCETINRGGTRYVEIMENVYGSIVPDARLQQPVFLGGTKFPVQIGTVVQSSQSTDSAALGTLAGKAQAANGGRLFRSKKKFDEAGYVMTIMCVSPRTGYSNGIPRKWQKTDVLDFFNPYFAHVGEQPIYNSELFYTPLDSTPESNELARATFGWQERYSEYRHPLSRVHGEMRKSKDDWHLFRQFDRTPSLNTKFIKMDVSDFTRIFDYEEIAGTQDEMFDMMIQINVNKKTPVPKYGTPYSFI